MAGSRSRTGGPGNDIPRSSAFVHVTGCATEGGSQIAQCCAPDTIFSMKAILKRFACAALLVASHAHANDQAMESVRTIGSMVADLHRTFQSRCHSLEAAASGSTAADADQFRELACGCGDQAVDAAFPLAGRAKEMTRSAFMERAEGAMTVCVARGQLRSLPARCENGGDPLGTNEHVGPSVAAARCICARKVLDARASADFAGQADAATAQYNSMPPGLHQDLALHSFENQLLDSCR